MGKNVNKVKNTQQNNVSLIVDISVLFLVGFIMAIMVYDLFASGNAFIKLIYSLGILLLLMVMYFIGIVPALSLDVIIVMATLIWSMHSYMTTGEMLEGMLFWLLMPTLIIIDCYILTQNITKLQAENRLVKAKTKELSTVDEVTHLRTSAIYKEHFEVFSTLSKDYDFPLYLYIHQIRYWNALTGMISKQDQDNLIQIITNTIMSHESGHEFVYYIDNTPPTWAILSTLGNDDIDDLGKVDDNNIDQNKGIMYYIQQEIYENIRKDPVLKNISIQLAGADIKFNPEEYTNATQFLADAIHELQYDV